MDENKLNERLEKRLAAIAEGEDNERLASIDPNEFFDRAQVIRGLVTVASNTLDHFENVYEGLEVETQELQAVGDLESAKYAEGRRDGAAEVITILHSVFPNDFIETVDFLDVNVLPALYSKCYMRVIDEHKSAVESSKNAMNPYSEGYQNVLEYSEKCLENANSTMAKMLECLNAPTSDE